MPLMGDQYFPNKVVWLLQAVKWIQVISFSTIAVAATGPVHALLGRLASTSAWLTWGRADVLLGVLPMYLAWICAMGWTMVLGCMWLLPVLLKWREKSGCVSRYSCTAGCGMLWRPCRV